MLSTREPVTIVGGDLGPEFVDGRTVVVRDDAGTVVQISVTNTGNLSRPAGITTPVDLGTSQVRGCISPIAGSDWVIGSMSARMAGILDGGADLAIADRQVHLVEHFSGPKFALQRLGSTIVNKAVVTDLPDAASGFRAYPCDLPTLPNTITRLS